MKCKTDAAEAVDTDWLEEVGDTGDTVSNLQRRSSLKRSVLMARGSYEITDGDTKLVTSDR